MESQGFVVQRHYLLDTAWIATYTHGKDETGSGKTRPVLGVNSEMDALPGIGHACGHNLIGVAGVAIACAVKMAMQTLDIDGKVVLLGTPGERSFWFLVRKWSVLDRNSLFCARRGRRFWQGTVVGEGGIRGIGRLSDVRVIVLGLWSSPLPPSSFSEMRCR